MSTSLVLRNTRPRSASRARKQACQGVNWLSHPAFQSCIYLLRSEPFFPVVFCESCFLGRPATLFLLSILRQIIPVELCVTCVLAPNWLSRKYRKPLATLPSGACCNVSGTYGYSA
jgi:hypothetical protein